MRHKYHNEEEEEFEQKKEKIVIKVMYKDMNPEEQRLYDEREEANKRGDDTKAALIKRLLYSKGVNVGKVDQNRMGILRAKV